MRGVRTLQAIGQLRRERRPLREARPDQLSLGVVVMPQGVDDVRQVPADQSCARGVALRKWTG